VVRALILSIKVAALGFAALRLVHPEIATSLRASRFDAQKSASRARHSRTADFGLQFRFGKMPSGKTAQAACRGVPSWRDGSTSHDRALWRELWGGL